MAKTTYEFITIANKDIRATSINEETRKAEAFIAKRFNDFKKSYPERFKNSNKKKGKGESIEQEVLQLLINITIEYLEEKDKIEELKKEMNIRIESLINRVELLL